MGFYLNSQGGYYEGDSASPEDQLVPQRPGPTYIWVNNAWAQSPTLVAQAVFNSAIISGYTITSTSTPAVNGKYDITPPSQSNIIAEQTSILTQQKFTNGSTTKTWPDQSGAFHIFPSTAVFTSFAEAVGTYVDALETALATAQQGSTPTWPSNSVVIP